MDDLLRRGDEAIVPELVVDAADFAADAARLIEDVASRRVLRILVVRGGEVIAEVGGRGATLRPLYGSHGGAVRVAEGVDLARPLDEILASGGTLDAP